MTLSAKPKSVKALYVSKFNIIIVNYIEDKKKLIGDLKMTAKKVKKVEEQDESVGNLIKEMNNNNEDEEERTEIGDEHEVPKLVSEDECFYKLTESTILLRNLLSGDNSFTEMENEALSDGIVCIEMTKTNMLELYFKMMNQELHQMEGEKVKIEE